MFAIWSTILTRFIRDLCEIYTRFTPDLLTIYTRFMHDLFNNVVHAIYTRWTCDLYAINMRFLAVIHDLLTIGSLTIIRHFFTVTNRWRLSRRIQSRKSPNNSNTCCPVCWPVDHLGWSSGRRRLESRTWMCRTKKGAGRRGLAIKRLNFFGINSTMYNYVVP